MRKYISFILVFTFVLTSCGTKKAASDLDKPVSERVALKNFEKNSPAFESISGKMKVSYESEKDAQSLSINYRILKDEKIWLSAKVMGLVSVAKVLITPEKVQYYEKLDKTYFDGDFRIAKEYLGLEIDFEQIQNLLIGRNLEPLKKKHMYYSENAYLNISELQNFLIFTAKISASDFLLAEQGLSQQDRDLKVFYKDYRQDKNSYFPNEILILAKENDDLVKIKLDYKSRSLNQKLSFPYSVPSSYKPAKL